MAMEIPSRYAPQAVEAKWAAHWEAHQFFRSVPDERPPYTVVIPPPNVTGVLHMGHMLNNTLQDMLVRRKRLEGYNACWVPGMDHASIATEAKVAKHLAEQGIPKATLSREEFLHHAWAWTDKYGGIILDQLKRLGASLDWARERFTMEEALNKQVIRVFCKLHEEGLIYRGHRMINWDPVGNTAVSDEEVVYKSQNARLVHVRYRGEDGGPGVVIATTRAETIMADTAVAVHPKDERYSALIGKRVMVPLVNRPVPVIADEYVDAEFGTGALKVTPAHSLADYEIGQRHGLEIIDVLNADGTLNERAEVHVGLDRFAARKVVIKDLEAAGLVEKIEDIQNQVGHSERTDTVIEPRLSEQWFVAMQPLAKMALKAVETGEVVLHPDRYRGTWNRWLEDIRDWNISRQLWWGQQIPAYYWDASKTKYTVAESREAAYQKAVEEGFDGSMDDLIQEADVVDTWFSSWLWPMSVFEGISDATNEDYAYYFPTSDLVTGPDIIFFWVARMVMASYYLEGRKPFTNVYFTGLIRDEKRRKMSKSLGNSPDVLALIDEYGADAIRIGLLLTSSAGNDLLYDEKLVLQGRNFANKLWNAFRLLHGLKDDLREGEPSPTEAQALRWLRARLNVVAEEVRDHYAYFRLMEVARSVYKLAWDDFCSVFLELLKPTEEQLSKAAYDETLTLFEELLLQLHPLMPFVTEEIWAYLRERTETDCACVAHLPETTATAEDRAVVARVDQALELVTAVRHHRGQHGLSPRDILPAQLKTPTPELVTAWAAFIERSAGLTDLQLVDIQPPSTTALVVGKHELYLPQPASGKPPAEERAELEAELQRLQGFLKGVEKKLANERFVASAPAEVVAKEQQKQADAHTKIAVLEQRLAGLG